MINFECGLVLKNLVTNETKTIIHNDGRITERLVKLKQDFEFNDINKESLRREIVQTYISIGNKPIINVNSTKEIEAIEKALRYFITEVYHSV